MTRLRTRLRRGRHESIRQAQDRFYTNREADKILTTDFADTADFYRKAKRTEADFYRRKRRERRFGSNHNGASGASDPPRRIRPLANMAGGLGSRPGRSVVAVREMGIDRRQMDTNPFDRLRTDFTRIGRQIRF